MSKNSNLLNEKYIVGGVFGMILGLEVFDELLDPPTKKLGFVSIWFSFAFALFLLNRQHKRKTFDTIQNCGWWETLLLILTGKLLLRILYVNSFLGLISMRSVLQVTNVQTFYFRYCRWSIQCFGRQWRRYLLFFCSVLII